MLCPNKYQPRLVSITESSTGASFTHHRYCLREELVQKVTRCLKNVPLMITLNLLPRVVPKAVWSANTKDCERCMQSFGFFGQRHHCRICAICVCHGCSSDVLPVLNEHQNIEFQRVCNDCHQNFRIRVAKILGRTSN
jgi:hypothetical protein